MPRTKTQERAIKKVKKVKKAQKKKRKSTNNREHYENPDPSKQEVWVKYDKPSDATIASTIATLVDDDDDEDEKPSILQQLTKQATER